MSESVLPSDERQLFGFPSPCCGARALTSFGPYPWMEQVSFYCPFCRRSYTGWPAWDGRDVILQDPVRIDWSV